MVRWLALLCLLAPSAAVGRHAPRVSVAAELGRGVRLYRDGDYDAAARALKRLIDAPIASRDFALYVLGEAEALAGNEAAALRRFRAVSPSSRFAARARARAADMVFARACWREAQAAYRAVLKEASPLVDLAVARFRLVVIDDKLGRPKPALVEAYRQVFDQHPSHPLAERALAEMRRLDAGTTVRAEERVLRAKLLIGERAWQRGIDELALVPAEATGAVRDEADYWIGTAHFKMRRGYEIAAEKLLAVAERLTGERQVEALFHGARAWSRVDQDDRAIAGYRQLVERFPRSHQAAEASFLVGWLEYNRGRYREALAPLETCAERFSSSHFGKEARWYLGFSRWLSDDVAAALTDFTELGRQPGALVGGKGRYWQGRALERLGRRDEAAALWKGIVEAWPFSYYALAARVRLAQLGRAVGPFGDAPSRSVNALAPLDDRHGGEPVLRRVDELLAAGLERDAALELESGERDLVGRLGASRALPILFDRYAKAGDFHRIHRLAESHAGGALSQDPRRGEAVAGWWKLAYPLAYREWVEKYAPTGGNPPYYLYTIMQKESAYNPHDVSYADAIGLLQMIPPTSRRIAEKIGRPYTEDTLYDPERNIQFGAWYIGHLLGKFGGQVALGAGSYNAGPKAMMRWLKKNGDRPLDEFIELCAYTQTREYMKKVLDIYARYLYLYEKKDYLPDDKVKATVLEDGIDY